MSESDDSYRGPSHPNLVGVDQPPSGLSLSPSTTTMTIVGDGDRTPLLSRARTLSSVASQNSIVNADVNTDSVGLEQDLIAAASNRRLSSAVLQSGRHLETFSGVFTPVCLSMFSALLFLRIGFILGQAGLYELVAQLLLAYTILHCTVLSICAISTNGAVEGGGAYFMISRTLGPEFGGSIGILFFFANIFSSALYITGCVEGFIDNFGPGGFLSDGAIPVADWWPFAYGSLVAFFNLIVCLIGAAMFAKTSVIIFIVVIFCTASVVISFLVETKIIEVPIPETNNLVGNITYVNYTGFSWFTLNENINSHYGLDYTTGNMVNFATVFGVLFSGVTGIMAGANMSGELKDPGRSIPFGTITAVCFTFVVYFLLSLLTAASCPNFLLRNNYIYMQYINMVPVLVPIGIFSATLSASLSNLIGASRVLMALAKDELFGPVLAPIAKYVWKDNPVAAVVVSWFLVQLILLIGSLNLIAQITSVFFLLSYCATNLACLGLELTSAPNYRPSFKFVSWHTCVIGLIGTLTMMFVINAAYAGVCIIICLLLVIVLHLKVLPSEWGSISQALIFHQVRKYLLMLDSRKDHVKFWRPQMLLLCSNPRSCRPLIEFVNDLKKSGLYVIGHVRLETESTNGDNVVASEYPCWLSLVDHLKVKAFVELTIAASVRDGMRHLVRLSGLGAMKPNTVILGFFDSAESIDFLQDEPYVMTIGGDNNSDDVEQSNTNGSRSFTELPELTRDKNLSADEYVGMIQDGVRMQKNMCICRHFQLLDKAGVLRARQTTFIDVWPMNPFCPAASNFSDNTTLFLLQLACILHMVPGWKSKTVLRVILCSKTTDDDTRGREKQMRSLLSKLRIQATINNILWDHVYELYNITDDQSNDKFQLNDLNFNYLAAFNDFVRKQSSNTAIIFGYLPLPPSTDDITKNVDVNSERYLRMLDTMTADLPPIVLIHGVSPVISTAL